MKISKLDLQKVFSAAKNNFIDDLKGECDDQEYVAKCYLKACAALLGVEVEFETRIPVETVD